MLRLAARLPKDNGAACFACFQRWPCVGVQFCEPIDHLARRHPEILIVLNHTGMPVERDLDGMRRVFPGFTGGANQPYRNYTIQFDDMSIPRRGARSNGETSMDVNEAAPHTCLCRHQRVLCHRYLRKAP